ncbi:endonuclease VII domain-containing protein [Streptomyces soliscabiei]|uniref:endonuclease VII domain-containing protein n=2 Tax=Streptomyces soliscabiei TaxID=588897 RepID=UPI0029B7990A|nr:endonuclease VII domain-containing protein [Streptomyces sp. NY05-11A]MDX2676219.1 endonuclease VII domain-containing protein [Streptomyces sp. NY05-11A]
MSDSSTGKRCSACKRTLPTSAFAANRSKLDRLQDRCRECGAEAYRRRREAQGKKVRRVDVPEGHKHCLGCDEVKPWREWHRNASASDGLSTRCKACRAVAGRERHLKRQYGMTEAERDELIASQMGVCCICLAAPATQVDHCHQTGRVRGVLCFNCNSGLGLLGDDPAAVNRAADYLEGNAWKPTLVAPGVYQLPS